MFGHGNDRSLTCPCRPSRGFHAEIEELSERRVTLWNSLSQGRDPAVVEEIKALDAQLDERWAQIRAERARIRFGERDEIVRRARAEERLERAA